MKTPIMPLELTLNEKLVWNFLFSDKNEYEINIELYCINGERSNFREKMRNIIKKGGKSILEDRVIHYEDKIIWKLEIK